MTFNIALGIREDTLIQFFTNKEKENSLFHDLTSGRRYIPANLRRVDITHEIDDYIKGLGITVPEGDGTIEVPPNTKVYICRCCNQGKSGSVILSSARTVHVRISTRLGETDDVVMVQKTSAKYEFQTDMKARYNHSEDEESIVYKPTSPEEDNDGDDDVDDDDSFDDKIKEEGVEKVNGIEFQVNDDASRGFANGYASASPTNTVATRNVKKRKDDSNEHPNKKARIVLAQEQRKPAAVNHAPRTAPSIATSTTIGTQGTATTPAVTPRTIRPPVPHIASTAIRQTSLANHMATAHDNPSTNNHVSGDDDSMISHAEFAVENIILSMTLRSLVSQCFALRMNRTEFICMMTRASQDLRINYDGIDDSYPEKWTLKE